MSEIIDSNNEINSSKNRSIPIGENGALIPIKLYQDVYHQLTGRTEQIGKKYKDDLQFEFSDLEQLRYKVRQLCDVHQIIAANELITIFYEKDRKEQYTSFDRFKLYNANATSPCLNVVVKFSFSILPAGLAKPQEYVVTIKLWSKLGLMKQMGEDDGPTFLRGYFLSRQSTAEVMVDYADYVIARGFLEALDEWIKGVRKLPRGKLLNIARRYSHNFPEFFKLSCAIGLTAAALSSAPSALTSSSIEGAARFAAIYLGGAYISLSLAELAGRWLEQAVDAYPCLSYVNLNKGDAKLIEEFSATRQPIYLRFAGSCILAVILSIAAGRLDKLI